MNCSHRRLTMLLLFLAALSTAPAAWGQPSRRPNLVFLLTDDQCTYSLGCYGNADVRTPHIDRLAADGMMFDRHYDTTAICMASRATIFTGKYEFKHGCNFGHGDLLRSHWQQAYPPLLRKAGYRVAMAGKIGVTVCQRPGASGSLPRDDFDAWGAGPGQTSYRTASNASIKRYAAQFPHSTLAYGAFGRDFIEQAAEDDAPFCLSISFKAPHRPATPDPRFDSVYAGRTFLRPENFGREFGRHFSRQSRQGRQYERFHSWGYADDYDRVMATYHQQVYAVDVAVGMIRKALQEAGVANNTVVLFTSDNGFLCGSHGYGSKVLPYEESSRVPLIVYDPRSGHAGGRRCDQLTGNIDIAPTLLSLAGVEAPPEMDGADLMQLYERPDRPLHESLALVNVWGPQAAHSLAVVTRDWKFVYWPYGGRGRDMSQKEQPEVQFEPTEELFHLRDSPLELSLSRDRSKLEQMRQRYDRLVRRWNEAAVPYHGYEDFGQVFDRRLAWEQKAPRSRD